MVTATARTTARVVAMVVTRVRRSASIWALVVVASTAVAVVVATHARRSALILTLVSVARGISQRFRAVFEAPSLVCGWLPNR